MLNITDIALGKLKNFLKKNEEGVNGFFVIIDKRTDELDVKKVYIGDKLLRKEEIENMKKQILNNGQ